MRVSGGSAKLILAFVEIDNISNYDNTRKYGRLINPQASITSLNPF